MTFGTRCIQRDLLLSKYSRDWAVMSLDFNFTVHFLQYSIKKCMYTEVWIIQKLAYIQWVINQSKKKSR